MSQASTHYNGNGQDPTNHACSRVWAWTGPESMYLFVSLSGQEPHQIFSGYIFRPIWSPNGDFLLFHGAGTFYAAQAPAFNLKEIPADFELDSNSPIVWVE